MKLDENKLHCMQINSKFGSLIHSLPLIEGLDRIIIDEEDDVTYAPNEDDRLMGHTLRLFLRKDCEPPMIYVHIDNQFAAQYSYFDDEFAKRTELPPY